MKTVIDMTYMNQEATLEYERFDDKNRPTEMILAVGRLAILRAAGRDGAAIGYINNPESRNSTVTTVAGILNGMFWFGVEGSPSQNQLEPALEASARKLAEALNSAPGVTRQWLSSKHEFEGETYPLIPLPSEPVNVHLKRELTAKINATQDDPVEFLRQLLTRTGALDAIANSL